MNCVTLKAGREKSLKRRHPWVFSNAIAKIDGNPQVGETVGIRTANGEVVGLGAYSPYSQITIRMWTFDPNEEISASFLRSRLEQAIRSRDSLLQRSNLTAYRVVNAESDGLPGLIVDRYAGFLVCQFLAAGMEYWKEAIIVQLNDLLPNTGIYDRSDVEVRKKEGLPLSKGKLSGQQPPELVEIQEESCRFLVDIEHGHKTGFYLDQRDNRIWAMNYSEGMEVLNCFAYTGGFAVWTIKGGAAEVTNIELSSSALELAHQNIELNRLDPTKVKHVRGDVFQVLRTYRDSRRQFDLIILDPPKFAESRSQLKRASRGYKDINLLAFKLLRKGGLLLTFSCSGLLGSELFQKIVADAALDAEREVQIIRRLSQAPDHPIALNFPEGSYLKGLVCKVLS